MTEPFNIFASVAEFEPPPPAPAERSRMVAPGDATVESEGGPSVETRERRPASPVASPAPGEL